MKKLLYVGLLLGSITLSLLPLPTNDIKRKIAALNAVIKISIGLVGVPLSLLSFHSLRHAAYYKEDANRTLILIQASFLVPLSISAIASGIKELKELSKKPHTIYTKLT